MIVIFFLRVLFGGVALGYVMGKICSSWLAKIFNDAVIETIITIAFPYITYFIGENTYMLCYQITPYGFYSFSVVMVQVKKGYKVLPFVVLAHQIDGSPGLISQCHACCCFIREEKYKNRNHGKIIFPLKSINWSSLLPFP